MNFSNKLIKLRKSNGLSQEELANNLNVSRQTISKWESGTTIPDMDRLKSISDLFGISVDDLISDTNEKQYIPNKEFIGVDEKYIPKQDINEANKNYVNSNKKSRKVFLLYLIPSVVFFIIFICFFIMIFKYMINISKKTSTEEQFNEIHKNYEEINNAIHKDYEELEEKAKHDKQNLIYQAQNILDSFEGTNETNVNQSLQ